MKIKFLNGPEREVALVPGADLRGADLRGADLRGADLSGADLHYADLRGADLRGADLRGADLRGADLSGANLKGADLRGANLRGADLSGADLRSADLRGANLSGANLRGADLSSADLKGADLRGVDLRDVNLKGADLSDAKGLGRFCILPAGDLIGYKKLVNGTIAVLRIPRDAKRVNAYGSRKCRAEFAYVVSGTGKAKHDGMTYAPGIVYPDKFDPDPRVECSHGIHFFITLQEAEDYT